MDSINRNQPEDNVKNLAGHEAIEKIRDTVKDADTCFFCTSADTGNTGGVRPMNAREVDEQGNVWFLSADDSHKNKEIEMNPAVKLYFQGEKHAEYLSLEGTATISRDKGTIKDLWSLPLKTWFTEGEDDPRITAIKVTPTDGYYWDTKHGTAVSGIKIMLGAAIGKTLDDSIEGTLKP